MQGCRWSQMAGLSGQRARGLYGGRGKEEEEEEEEVRFEGDKDGRGGGAQKPGC
jgi:hypothetical protein